MTKKQLVFLLFAVALLCAYVFYFTDWFASERIQIFHTTRPYTPSKRARARNAEPPAVNPISFGFNRKYELTEIKVVPVSDLATNKYPHPVWHLVSESNSVPIKAFVYGMNIKGMHPKVKNAPPEPLAPGVTYRLFVTAGDLHGEHDFTTVPRTGPAR